MTLPGTAPRSEGEWKRLHPATPLLKGGIAFIAVVGFVFASFRERIVETAVGSPGVDNVVVRIYERGQLGWAIVIVIAVLAVGVVGFWLSWTKHRFRINAEAVEVKSGILFRTNRKARLDRIQDIVITRPTLARLFGAARLELSVAGQDSTVQLAYLRSSEVDLLRREILVLAGGLPAVNPADPAAAVAADSTDSVVRIPLGRLLGSVLLRGVSLVLFLGVGVVLAGTVLNQELVLALLLVPGILAGIGYFYSHLIRSLRFSIAGSAEGVRIGYGLFSLSSDTLPPGRIHAVEVYQGLLWRPLGWWAVRINRAGQGSKNGRSRQSAIVLPVGRIADVQRVLALLLPASPMLAEPETVRAGLMGKDAGPVGFVAAPTRAFWLRPLSWWRTAFAVTGDAVLIRRGLLSRSWILVPLARLQSLDRSQGPIRRLLGLGRLRLHTVSGPVRCDISVPGASDAEAAFTAISAATVRAVAEEQHSAEGIGAGS